MGCCGDEEEHKEPDDLTRLHLQGLVINRRCRDILCLLLFIVFWAGMFVICGIAFKEGEPNRLIYGVDSYGMTCGSKNTFFNASFDLTDSKNMYWIDPLSLLSPTGVMYAKTICSPGCPTGTQVCSKNDFPCESGDQFTCPYYRFAEDSLYGRVPGVDATDITYWTQLASVTNVSDGGAAAQFVASVKGLGGAFAIKASQLESNLSGRYYQVQSQFPGNGPCYPNLFDTKEFFFRCFPVFPGNLTKELVQKAKGVVSTLSDNSVVKEVSSQWQSNSQKWARYVGDISRGILVIVIGGLAGGLVMSLLWLVVLRYLGGVMVWLAILFVNLSCIGACLFAWVKAGYIGNSGIGQDIVDALPGDINPSSDEQRTWFWVAVTFSIVAALVLLITLLCITRIKIAVACVKVASQAVGAMPTIIFFPFIPFIFEIGLIIYWVAVTALLYSAGDLTAWCRPEGPSATFSFAQFTNVSNVASTTQTLTSADAAMFNGTSASAGSANASGICYTNFTTDERAFFCGRDPNCYLSYKWNNRLKYAFIFHFFGLLWTNQVIIGFSCVTIAGAIAHFYWSRGDSVNMPTFPVLTALKNTVFYHMGSICFGGFIVALIQLIRAMLEYLDRKTKELQAQNKCAEWAMCCVKCCMWCIENIVKFINRNAYIMIAVKGQGYCCAAFSAVKLLITNCLRVAVVNMVADVLIFLGKISVAATAGVIAYAMTEAKYYNSPSKYPDTYLYSPVLVIALSAMVAFVVA
ncbi:Choline transporter-like protein 2, partial [Tetrabaena socialis]